MIEPLLLLTTGIALAQAAAAEVTLTRGPTPIPDGEALAEGDITLRNDHLAFTLAIESQAPWGVPRGDRRPCAGKEGRARP
jgi:hypothetical protein